MKRATVVHLNHSKLYLVFSKNVTVFLFFFVFLLSMLTGCILYANGILRNQSALLAEYLLSQRTSIAFGPVFFASFGASFVFLFAVFLSGTSLTGVAFIPIIMIFRGFLTGLFLSFLYNSYGFSAIAFNLLIFIPSSCFSVLAMVAASRQSLELSYSLGRLLLKDGQSDYDIHLKRHLTLFGTFLFLTAVSALLDAMMSVCFQRYFEFG